jgi:AraC-like DNA-binding protein
MGIDRRGDRLAFFAPDTLLPELPHVGWTRPRSARVAGLGPHRHVGWELCWLRRGTLDWWAGQHVHSVPAGHCYITQPGEEHGGAHSLLQPCDLFWLELRPQRGRLPGLPAGETAALLDGLAGLPHRVFPGDAALGGLWQRLLDEHARPGPHAATAARSALHALVVTVLRCSARHAATAPSPAIAAAMERAVASLDRGVAVAEMAHAAGLSPSRFHARFCAEVGETPADFLRRRRIDHAKHLLATTGREVTDIALALGFPSSQYFATVFRRYSGMTPRAFREQARNAPT